jgi:hypothetical protein
MTKKADKCNASPFCRFDKSSRRCVLRIDSSYLQYFTYLLSNDLINNKLEAETIIRGSFIPEYSINNQLFRNPDEVMFSTSELSSIITKGIYSKYKHSTGIQGCQPLKILRRSRLCIPIAL